MDNNKLNNIVDKYSLEFNFIIENINSFIEYRSTERNDDLIEDSLEATLGCVNGLAKIVEYSLEYGSFRDSWDYDKFYQHIYGPELIVKSQKTKCNYMIGLDENGIYLSTDLRYNDNLRYMDDQFWRKLLNLSEFEGFEYSEYESSPDEIRKKHPELFKTNRSMIYRIMRKYFFDCIDKDSQYCSSSVGEFKITWDKNKTIEHIVRQCSLAFKEMYQLNYQLWKISYLKK